MPLIHMLIAPGYVDPFVQSTSKMATPMIRQREGTSLCFRGATLRSLPHPACPMLHCVFDDQYRHHEIHFPFVGREEMPDSVKHPAFFCIFTEKPIRSVNPSLRICQ